MRESRKIVLGLLLLCSLLFFVSCDQNPGAENNTEQDGGDNTGADNTGNDNTGDNTDDVVENPTQAVGDNIVLTKLLDETCDVNAVHVDTSTDPATLTIQEEKAIEVRFTVTNISTDDVAEGTEAVIAGWYILSSDGNSYNWDSSANAGEGLIGTVTGGEVTFTFYYYAELDNTDFKVFVADGSWADVANDKGNNVQVDIAAFAEPGDVITMVLDASVE